MTEWNGPAQPAYGPVEPALVWIGDVSCTQTQVITPSGSIPIAQAQWILTDQTRTEQRIPPWAIVCAVIGFFLCLLGLPFLLVKETVVIGQLQITVQGPGFLHVTYVPVDSEAAKNDVYGRINYARSLGMAAH